MKFRTALGITLIPVTLYVMAIAAIAQAPTLRNIKPAPMPTQPNDIIDDTRIQRLRPDYDVGPQPGPLLTIAPAARIDINNTTPDSTVVCYKDECRRLAELFPPLRSTGLNYIYGETTPVVIK